MTQTLQAVRFPDLVLDEMLRVGKECVITFPNFGNWRCRLHLALMGRMPVSRFLPYTWYDTPNIHFCTVFDFEALCRLKNPHHQPGGGQRGQPQHHACAIAAKPVRHDRHLPGDQMNLDMRRRATR